MKQHILLLLTLALVLGAHPIQAAPASNTAAEMRFALRADDFTRSAHSLHFYDSIVVIEKRPMSPPKSLRVGEPSF